MTAIVKVSDKQIKDSYDGFDLYFDHQDKILYSSPKCLARWVGCHPNSIKRIASVLNVGKESKVQTRQGLRHAKLFNETEIKQILLSLATGDRILFATKQNAKNLLDLINRTSLVDAAKNFKQVKGKLPKNIPAINEKSVAQFLKSIHELSGDEVSLEKTIDMSYRPDMMIFTPSTGQIMAVEVEPYERRRYGLQQAITYAKFSHSKPYLITFGNVTPCKVEQLTLARYDVAWLHLKSDSKLDDAEFISNFGLMGD